MKPGKASRLSEIRTTMLFHDGKVEISVMMKFCRGTLDGKGITDKWLNKCVAFHGKKKKIVMHPEE